MVRMKSVPPRQKKIILTLQLFFDDEYRNKEVEQLGEQLLCALSEIVYLHVLANRRYVLFGGTRCRRSNIRGWTDGVEEATCS